MLYRICSKCGNKIRQGTRCNCSQPQRRYRDKNNDEGQRVYKTSRWKKISKQMRTKYSNVDIYAYYKYNRFIQSDMVHHIIPVKDDMSKAYVLENLIPLSNKSHREVEARYKKSPESKRMCIEEIREFISRWERGI